MSEHQHLTRTPGLEPGLTKLRGGLRAKCALALRSAVAEPRTYMSPERSEGVLASQKADEDESRQPKELYEWPRGHEKRDDDQGSDYSQCDDWPNQ